MFTDRRSNSTTTKRKRQAWPKDKPFKILSLDGGGIRGIFGACLLNKMQQNYGAGEHLSRYFDLIAGTSTGGIIAIGLGLQIPTEKIEMLYMLGGKKIFPPFWTRFKIARFLKSLFMSLHNHKELESALKKNFEDKLFGESKARLVIPSFLGPKAEIAVFKTDHHPDIKHDWKTEAWKIARSTSAAPTFLQAMESNEGVQRKRDKKYFLDGGVWANNPIMSAIVDAMSSYDIELEQIKVLSIGTGNSAPSVSKRGLRGGLVTWKKIISTAMFLTTDNALGQAGLLIGPENILRLEPDKVNSDIELDDWYRARMSLPNDADRTFTENADSIAGFFSETVASREAHYCN
ncbi:CBASS cGAMP-activated phospholipase [Parasphingorhabdus sp.]|uniref:CBASS cGAMP-activated phospholipase n=1 Tax=Parasphingorhabdus sp. TaxID=2709688 RepID=UPI003265AB37